MSQETPAAKLDLEVARRLHKALTAGAEELFRVMQDPSPEVLRTALRNTHLTEEHLLCVLKRRDLPEEMLKAIYQLERTAGSHRLRLALAKNPVTPGSLVLAIVPHLYLFELLDLCILPGTTPDQRFAAERQIIQRLPSIELGNKLALARRGTSTLVGELLKEGDPRLVEACLGSPRLKEISVLQFLNGPRATAATISMVARHPGWENRPNLRLAILKNPKTPPVWFTLFLPKLATADVLSLLSSRRISPNQKQLVEGELKKRGRA